MAFQYAAHQDPSPDQVESWGDDWNGCKLWGSCGGTRCHDGGARAAWGSPVKYPSHRPSGVHPERARARVCPRRSVDPSLWTLMQLWGVWRQFGGLPGPGSLEEQPARVCEGFSVLEAERDLMSAYRAEEQARRSKASR